MGSAFLIPVLSSVGLCDKETILFPRTNSSVCLKLIIERYRGNKPNDLADNIEKYFQSRSVRVVCHTDVVLTEHGISVFRKYFL